MRCRSTRIFADSTGRTPKSFSTGGDEKDGDRILPGNDLTANGADH